MRRRTGRLVLCVFNLRRDQGDELHQAYKTLSGLK